ncbi:TadE/TadG family type IV pilus assembly protein [Caulobacter sp. DWR2-3-1b2]|uniref:TadE/TadG family type IV pilus assembly protein n=1 Tax=unclassified Caulobacter TaxID=2648921 RepID=UPI00199D2128|nr:pilus assembly protein [Caulobacter sp.]
MADHDRKSRPAPRAPKGLLRRFARAHDGATAVEFAFVSIPFLVLVFAILELGVTFMVSLTLEAGLSNMDRTIRTGELQSTGGTAATFKAQVCEQMSWLGSGCASALHVDVRALPSFGATGAATAPNLAKTCWDPGGPGSIVLVRAYYKWPIMTPLLQDAVAGDPGDRMVTYSAVFTNEPYSDTPAASVKCP